MYILGMFFLFKFVKALWFCFFFLQQNVIMKKAFPKPFLSQGPVLKALGHDRSLPLELLISWGQSVGGSSFLSLPKFSPGPIRGAAAGSWSRVK